MAVGTMRRGKTDDVPQRQGLNDMLTSDWDG